MESSSVVSMLGAGVTFIAVIVGIIKWFVTSSETRVNEKFKENSERFKENDALIRENEKQINDTREDLQKSISETRDEMHREYVHNDHLEKYSAKVDKGMSAIFKKMDAVARDLNRLIGRQANNKDASDDE